MEFKYIGGDQPDLVVGTENVVSHGDGIASSGMTTYKDGKVAIYALGADFFRQPSSSDAPVSFSIQK